MHDRSTTAGFRAVLLAMVFTLAQGCSSLNGEDGDQDGNGNSGGDPGSPLGSNFDLSDYREYIPVTDLPFIPDDLSGITYNFDRDTFFLIRNNTTTIWEVTTSYALIRTISTDENFGDSEGITYLGNSEFAIVSEDGILFIGTIPDGVADIVIFRGDFQRVQFAPDGFNQGPEGVTFDHREQRFYVVKEENPRKLYTFPRPATGSDVTVTATEPFDANTVPNRPIQDMAGVVFNPNTGRLLIVSDRDYGVMDIALDGTVFGTLYFPDSLQYEGITFDNDSNIHVVGEPRFYHVWSPH